MSRAWEDAGRATRVPCRRLRLATFNINNIAKRLAVLLEWLTRSVS